MKKGMTLLGFLECDLIICRRGAMVKENKKGEEEEICKWKVGTDMGVFTSLPGFVVLLRTTGVFSASVWIYLAGRDGT